MDGGWTRRKEVAHVTRTHKNAADSVPLFRHARSVSRLSQSPAPRAPQKLSVRDTHIPSARVSTYPDPSDGVVELRGHKTTIGEIISFG